MRRALRSGFEIADRRGRGTSPRGSPAGLDESLVVAGLSQHIRVFDRGVFEPTAASDDEPMEHEHSQRPPS